MILVIESNGYIHLVPYTEAENFIFFKTVVPSRKYTKLYLKGVYCLKYPPATLCKLI